MTIPPFPSQDLAKLVLGYLAEEQLMTAYDEFLQASPYLDALRNEYDRIFMTSLKNILAEYRAVKIYVETCKPVGLRRRLFGCANLLEVVKVLIQNLDLSKFQPLESSCTSVRNISNVTETDRTSFLSRTSSCDVCNSLRLVKCVCKSRHPSDDQSQSQVETTTENVDATALEDLPGHHTGKKHIKVLEKDSKSSFSISCTSEQNTIVHSKVQSESCNVSESVLVNYQTNTHTQAVQGDSKMVAVPSQSHPVNVPELLASKEKIEEFNKILNIVCNNKNIADKSNTPRLCDVAHGRISTSFQDFASGVSGGREGDNGSTNLPDSSTCENSVSVCQTTKESATDNSIQETGDVTTNAKAVTKATILLKVENVKKKTDAKKDSDRSPFKTAGSIKPKTNEQKVTILSDIKVDKTINNPVIPTMPAVLKNATSTPVMQMQTILINGTPAYKHDTKAMKITRYTKDEIMAMPTIILVPSSGAPNTTSQSQSTCTTAGPNVTTSSTARQLGPLMIDVVASSSTAVKMVETTTNNNTSDTNGMLVKTVEMKNASIPKTGVDATKSTPHSQPIVRKSSSTPRRTSHVRVLDFTTPRRILQDTINEHEPNPVETIVSKSPSLNAFTHSVSTEHIDSNVTTGQDCNNTDVTCSKENQDSNKIVPTKKYNWDADLRALAIANPKDDGPSTVTNICKSRRSSKNKSDSTKDGDKKSKRKSRSKSASRKPVAEEIVEDVVDVVTTVEDVVVVPVKPTINIISRPDWGAPTQEKDVENKSQNKSNTEDPTDTPELDRISLQNVIGAKLNISDLLETPYKQVLYDIQMETPRFLGPDLPGDPMSDIKIMNIPTPRFLNTPKSIQQPTPSSYSSRPTDYSSGGSYYKPDDQDYIPVDDLEYPVTSNKANVISPIEIISDSPEKPARSSRPIRKCTQNVSYFKSSPFVGKPKDAVDKAESNSTCSDKVSNSSHDRIDKEVIKPPREPKSTPQAKTPLRKKYTPLSKKKKTPVKRESKAFMKIRPRKPTPTKPGRSKKKVSESQGRRRTSSKEKHHNVSSSVTSAPTKSRRKSSTPRKLHCTKAFNSESSGHDSPDLVNKNKETGRESSISCTQDSDAENLPLRWSDDASQDRLAETQNTQSTSTTETEDITKIQEYIARSENSRSGTAEGESNLHIDLIKRGFDIETAKSIERDLLDTPPCPIEDTRQSEDFIIRPEIVPEAKISQTNANPIVQADDTSNKENEEEEEEEEIELTPYECNEDSKNYISYVYDESSKPLVTSPPKLKDKYSMEVCIDDGVSIRLRATPFTMMLDQDPEDVETEMAVNSIPYFDKLYTPIKEAARAQCYEIFDSTLTSLDTPLKVSSPKRSKHEVTVTEIVLEVEKEEDVSEKHEGKKRKRLQSGNASDESANESKRAKPESQYLLNSANIQNIDIETVLSKLHGP